MDLQNASNREKGLQVSITKITTTKLRNVEMLYGDKNDVFVILKFGDKWSARTATLWEGGSDVSWSYSEGEAAGVSMKWSTTVRDLMSGVLEVTAMDDNKMTAAKLIGHGQQQVQVHMDRAVSTLLQSSSSSSSGATTDVVIEVPLLDKVTAVAAGKGGGGGKSAGSITVTMRISSIPIPIPTSISVPSEHERAAITAATAAVTVVVPEYIAPIQPSPLLINTAPSVTHSYAPGIKDHKRGEEPTTTCPPFVRGVLRVKRIKCTELKSVEMVGKNDPYVTLDFGTESCKTDPLDGAGGEALFDFLDFKFQVQEDLLKFENMTVKVFDKNSVRNDVLIGSSVFSLKNILLNANKKIETDISLIIHDEKGKKSGCVTLYVHLDSDIPEVARDLDLQIPHNFEPLILRIVRVKLLDLKYLAGVLSSKVNNPYVRVDLGSQKLESKPVCSLGVSSPLLENLDLTFEITEEMLSQNENEKSVSKGPGPESGIKVEKRSTLSVEVMDSTVGFDSHVGVGAVNIRNTCLQNLATLLTEQKDEKKKYQSTTEVEVAMDLATKKGESAGRAVLYVTLELKSKVQAILNISSVSADPSESESKLEDDGVRKFFKGGVLWIDSITAHDLRNTEMIGKQVCLSQFNVTSLH